MSVPVTDETRAYMARAFLIRATDEDYARHCEGEARRYGASDAQIADAWKTRAALNAPTVIPARFDERYDPSPDPIDRRIA